MHGWRRRLVEVVRPGRLDQETIDELTHHLDLLVKEKRERGLAPEEARRQALAEAGSSTSVRQQLAEGRAGFRLERTLRELTWAARQLRRTPGLSGLSVATLAVGIGAAAILVALLDGIVFRPLPYPEPDRLVRIFDTNAPAGVDRAGVASGNVVDWRQRVDAFDGVAGYYVTGRTVSVGVDAEVTNGAQVTAGFFEIFEVPPLVGRTFTEDETRRATFSGSAAPTGPDPVVVLSHGLWRAKFGEDPAIVGRTVTVERRPFRVVGVMPSGFQVPDPDVQLWTPWHIDGNSPRDQHYLGAVARIRRGLSLPAAEARLNAVARQLAEEYPETNDGWGVRLVALADERVGSVASALWLLFGSVGVVLVVVAANVALLSLIRGLDRRGESAVRLALGASEAQLRREILWEALWLALAGGAGGLLVALAGLQVVPALATLPRLDEVELNGRVYGFVAAVTVLSAIVAGLPQFWRGRSTLTVELSGAMHRATGDRDRHRLRDGIVVVQVALTVVLLIVAGLFVRSVANLRSTPLGVDPRGVLVAPVFLDAQAYNSGARAREYYRLLFERLSALPGVVSVGGSTTVPTSTLGPDFDRPVWPDTLPVGRAGAVPASVRVVTPGYFETVRLRVVAGRAFEERDAPDAPRVVMVSETLAGRLWPGASAIGKRLVVDYSTDGTSPYEVVGVVGDVRFRGARSEPLAEIYLAHAQRSYLILNVVVRTEADPRALITPARDAFRAVDPQKPAQGMYALEDLIAMTYARERSITMILGVFALATSLLAGLGIYGVLSQRIRERTREIGIRLAVGGMPRHIVEWVAGWALRLVGAGLGAGVLIALALGRSLEGLLFGVQARDGITFAAVAAAAALVCAAGSFGPLWRALHVDPVDVLRR